MENISQEKTLIQDPKAKYITFSKRRSGLFKKANELCTLCAVKMAIILFSPGGKAYSYGNSSTDAIINRFTNSNARAIGEDGPQPDPLLTDLYQQYSTLVAQLDAEKKRGIIQNQKLMTIPTIDKMNKDQLLKLKASLEDLKQSILDRVTKRLVERSVSPTLTIGGVYAAGNPVK